LPRRVREDAHRNVLVLVRRYPQSYSLNRLRARTRSASEKNGTNSSAMTWAPTVRSSRFRSRKVVKPFEGLSSQKSCLAAAKPPCSLSVAEPADARKELWNDLWFSVEPVFYLARPTRQRADATHHSVSMDHPGAWGACWRGCVAQFSHGVENLGTSPGLRSRCRACLGCHREVR
jgi:hypothetical protein